MLIVGSYHKTGTVLIKHIFKNIYGKKMYNKTLMGSNLHKFIFRNHFNSVSNEYIKNNKSVIIIRNPYEIICSGMRYHQRTIETWAQTRRKLFNGLSYKQKINSLKNDDEKLMFEMNNYARNTIKAIYNDIKNRNLNKNIYILKLEDLYDQKNLPKICKEIHKHINNKEISYNKILVAFKTSLNIDFHRTNKKNEYTYPKLFKKIHYDRFNTLFPKDLFKVLGYQ